MCRGEHRQGYPRDAHAAIPVREHMAINAPDEDFPEKKAREMKRVSGDMISVRMRNEGMGLSGEGFE